MYLHLVSPSFIYSVFRAGAEGATNPSEIAYVTSGNFTCCEDTEGGWTKILSFFDNILSLIVIGHIAAGT